MLKQLNLNNKVIVKKKRVKTTTGKSPSIKKPTLKKREFPVENFSMFNNISMSSSINLGSTTAKSSFLKKSNSNLKNSASLCSTQPSSTYNRLNSAKSNLFKEKREQSQKKLFENKVTTCLNNQMMKRRALRTSYNDSNNLLSRSVNAVNRSVDNLRYLSNRGQNELNKKKVDSLQTNIKSLKKRLKNSNKICNEYRECNDKVTNDLIEVEYQQEELIHDRIHMTGLIPRTKCRNTEIVEEIIDLDRKAKMYEILKLQFIQEISLMNDDILDLKKKVMERALENNKTYYEIQRFKRGINELKIAINEMKKNNSFMKDVKKMMKFK